MNIYPKSLEAVTKVVLILEEVSQGSVEDDSGVILGSMPLYTTDGRLIGAVNVDDDEHVYFTPSEDDYYEDDAPDDGEKQFFDMRDAGLFKEVVEVGDFAPVVDIATVREVA